MPFFLFVTGVLFSTKKHPRTKDLLVYFEPSLCLSSKCDMCFVLVLVIALPQLQATQLRLRCMAVHVPTLPLLV